jgi:DNA topoisomerase-1
VVTKTLEEDKEKQEPVEGSNCNVPCKYNPVGVLVKEDGTPVPENIGQLRIPPAWVDIEIDENPDASLLVKGRDSKGRPQYIYTEGFKAQQTEEKFARVKALSDEYEDIHAENIANIDSDKKEEAECMCVVMGTGIRPGSDSDRKAEVQAYGATTLEGRHVVVDGDDVSLQFVGKKGIEANIPVTDDVAKDILATRAEAVGPKGRLFDTNAGVLREYSQSLGSGGYKTKDFRTLLGTTAASEIVSQMPTPATKKEYKAQVKTVATEVASKLGNTPAVALKSYINPIVTEPLRKAQKKWESGVARKRVGRNSNTVKIGRSGAVRGKRGKRRKAVVQSNLVQRFR